MATGIIQNHSLINYSTGSATIYKQGYWCYYRANVPKGTADQTTITVLPSACYAINTTAMSTFYMNGEDAGKECAAYCTTSTVQFRTTTATTGSGGVLISGVWLTHSST